MSQTPEQDFTASEGTNPDSLDLGQVGYVPTQPASEYVGPLPDAAGNLPPAYPPATGYTPEAAAPPAYPPAPDFPVYDPTAPAQPAAPVAPYASSAYPPVAYPTSTESMVAGQVVPTPFGTFIVGDKSKMAAGVMGIVLGGFGAGQFYRGNVGMGIAQIAATILTCGVGWLWAAIEGIMVLVAKPGAPLSLDAQGRLMA